MQKILIKNKIYCPACRDGEVINNRTATSPHDWFECLDCRRQWAFNPKEDKNHYCRNCTSTLIIDDEAYSAGELRFWCDDCQKEIPESDTNHN